MSPSSEESHGAAPLGQRLLKNSIMLPALRNAEAGGLRLFRSLVIAEGYVLASMQKAHR